MEPSESPEAGCPPAGKIVYDLDSVLTVALDICEGMLESGAEIHRVEDTAERICRAYGAERVEIFAISPLIVATISASGQKDCTQSRRVYGNANNLFRIEKLNALSRTICRDTPDPKLVGEEIADIRASECYPKLLKYAGGFLGAVGFTLFFGGGLIEALLAGLVGLFVCLLDFNRPKYLNQIACTAIISAVGSLLIALACKLIELTGLIDLNEAVVNIGVIMLLIPGMALGNAVRDLLCGEVVSGAVKSLQSVLVATAIAGGFTVVLLLFGTNNINAISAVSSVTVGRIVIDARLLMILYSGLGTLGFSILFGVPFKRMLYALLCGMLGCACYLAASGIRLWELPPALISSAVGAAACTLYAEIMARLKKTPTTMFLIPGLITLVPGSALYYTIAFAVQRSKNESIGQGLTTLFTCIGIALGIVVVSVIFQIVWNRIRGMKDGAGKDRAARRSLKGVKR